MTCVTTPRYEITKKNINNACHPWDHFFITYAKFSEKLIFLTHIYILGVRNVSFSGEFEYILNEWSPSQVGVEPDFSLKYFPKKLFK